MSWIARIFMGLMGLVFLAGLLLALGVYTVFASLRWLLTGRKPQVVLVWQQFSHLRRSGSAPWGRSPAYGQHSQEDVVDVEVREVRDSAPRLPGDKT